MSLSPGEKLGPYEILSLIGAGGMGEVYKARDTRVNREVAIKTSRAGFGGRFQKEAEAIAALNHPNICTLFDVGPDYLVMEYIEGLTLAERIRQGPIPLEESLAIAGQIAAALEAAHEKTIVHRDLKPANVKLRPDGSVKVLDFGLAKAGAASEVTGDSPTLMTVGTQAGMILGTAGYMSPEQARGQVADKRADIWGFGVVLYEMVTGTRLFDGATVTDSLAAILTLQPDLPKVPVRVRRLLARCLEKDPNKRLRGMGDWAELLGESAATAPLPSRLSKTWIAAVALFALALGSAATYFLTRPAPPPEARLDIVTPPTTAPESFALSPDGQQIAYVAANGTASQLWVRSLASASAQPVAGTEGASSPFWSPDSRSVGFLAEGKLKRVDLGGSAPQILADVSGGSGATWNAEGTILFSPNPVSGLFRVPATGGQPTPVTRLSAGQAAHRQPRFLPDGQRFLFYVAGSQPGVYMGELGKQGEKGGGIGMGTEPRRLTAADSAGEYVVSGWLTFVQQNTLLARRFDATRGQLSGDPVTLAQSVGVDGLTQAGAFSVSRSGLIAWRTGTGASRQLFWFNRAGERTGTPGAPDAAGLYAPELSPDGRRVAVTRGTVGARDIWLTDGDRSTRFTFDPAEDVGAVWSPDGSRVVFASNRKGTLDLYVKPADGSGPEQMPMASTDAKIPNSWSPDGRFLLYRNGLNGNDLMVLPVLPERNGKPYPFLSTPFDEANGVFSPDGNWVAYESNESGRNEVYLRPFPGPGGVWQISAGGGTQARWRADGKELYYVAPGNKLMAAAIAAHAGSIKPGQPVALFTANFARGLTRPQYDVARDGRFLVNVELTDTATPPITLLMNWKPPQ